MSKTRPNLSVIFRPLALAVALQLALAPARPVVGTAWSAEPDASTAVAASSAPSPTLYADLTEDTERARQSARLNTLILASMGEISQKVEAHGVPSLDETESLLRGMTEKI